MSVLMFVTRFLSLERALIPLLAAGVLINAQPSFALSANARVLTPIMSLLLLDDDNCLSMISVGDVVFDTLSPNCRSEGPTDVRSGGAPGQYYSAYYSFTHTGGSSFIDLISDFPNSYDAFLFLREGEGKTGTIVRSDDNSHEDWGSARIVIGDGNLAPGKYTIEATSYAPGTQGAYNLSVYGFKVTAKATGKLNDTGIIFSGYSATSNSTYCASPGNFAKQDCSFGRDADDVVGSGRYVIAGDGFDTVNDGDGQEGFSFSGVEASGLSMVTPWSCIKDNVTGLMWELKTGYGLHYSGDTYSWYNSNPNENGGHSGSENYGVCSGGSGLANCNTESFVNAVNAAGLCGYNDWRLPDVTELLGLLNLQTIDNHLPSMDPTYFPFAPAELFWSALPYANETNPGDLNRVAWTVHAREGGVSAYSSDFPARVRLVRG